MNYKTLVKISLFISTIAAPFVWAQNGEEYGKTQEDTSLADKMTSHQFNDGDEWLKYRLHTPDELKKGEKYPLLVFLHGFGERGTDNIRQIKKAVPELLTYGKNKGRKFFLLAPQFKNFETWLNGVRVDLVKSYNSPEKPSLSLNLTIKVIKEMMEKMPIDTDRIYVTGLSQGGFGTWDILVREPDLFAAAVPVAAGNADDKANTVKHIPLWVIHGAKDDVISVEFSRNSVNNLRKVGGNPVYTEPAEMTHADPDWHSVYSNEYVWDWVFTQVKN